MPRERKSKEIRRLLFSRRTQQFGTSRAAGWMHCRSELQKPDLRETLRDHRKEIADRQSENHQEGYHSQHTHRRKGFR
jgi:hypothetical protein